MPTQIYKVDGVRVPSTTTVVKPYGDCGALMYWANQAGFDQKTLQEARQETATPGSMTHDKVNCHIRLLKYDAERWREQFDSEELFRDAVAKSDRAFQNFERWAELTRFKLLQGEVSLVSQKHRFGGTLDAVMTRDGVALADWKTGTSGAIYPDFLYQVAAYGLLWNENFPDNPITAGYHIIRFNREYGDFSHWHFSELDDAIEGFLLLRKMYDLHKRVTKRVK